MEFKKETLPDTFVCTYNNLNLEGQRALCILKADIQPASKAQNLVDVLTLTEWRRRRQGFVSGVKISQLESGIRYFGICNSKNKKLTKSWLSLRILDNLNTTSQRTKQ